MKRLILAASLFAASPVLAQVPSVPGEIVPVPFDARERGAIMAMCPAAVWANRQQFEGLCEYFKTKFDAAEKAAADAKAAKPVEKKE